MPRHRRIVSTIAGMIPLALLIASYFSGFTASYLTHSSQLRTVLGSHGLVDIRWAHIPSKSDWWLDRRGSWLPEYASLYSGDADAQYPAAYEHRTNLLLVSFDRYQTAIRSHPGTMLKSGYVFPAVTQIRLRLWPITTLALLPLTLHVLRPRSRQSLGLCPTCSYDLRATPERCPECGTIPAR